MAMPILHEEANLKETICPLSFSVQEIRSPDWNGVREPGPWPCSGRRCMAWRFGRTNIKGPDGDLVRSDDTHGFCGLAGVPGQGQL